MPDVTWLEQGLAEHGDAAYRVCLRIVGNGEDAADAFQEGVLVLIRRAELYRPGASVSAWICGTMRWAAIEVVRRRERQQRSIPPDASSPAGYPVVSIEHGEQIELVREQLAALSEQDRTALTLRYFEGMSDREIGHVLGVGQNATTKRISRALTKLRSRLERIVTLAALVGLLREAAAAETVSGLPAALSQWAVNVATCAEPPQPNLVDEMAFDPFLSSAPQYNPFLQGVISMAKNPISYCVLAVATLCVLAFPKDTNGEERIAPEPTPVVASHEAEVAEAGLHVLVEMDQTELTQGGWSGRVLVRNDTQDRIHYHNDTPLTFTLVDQDGAVVDNSRYIGVGDFDPSEMRRNVNTLAPGESAPVFTFSSGRQLEPFLGGTGAGILGIGWDLVPEKTYTLRVSISADQAFRDRMVRKFGVRSDIWIGDAISGNATVRVLRPDERVTMGRSRIVDQLPQGIGESVPAAGLRVVVDMDQARLEKGTWTGRILVLNDSDAVVRYYNGTPLTFMMLDQDGVPARQRTIRPASAPDPAVERSNITELQPGDSVTVFEFGRGHGRIAFASGSGVDVDGLGWYLDQGKTYTLTVWIDTSDAYRALLVESIGMSEDIWFGTAMSGSATVTIGK